MTKKTEWLGGGCFQLKSFCGGSTAVWNCFLENAKPTDTTCNYLLLNDFCFGQIIRFPQTTKILAQGLTLTFDITCHYGKYA